MDSQLELARVNKALHLASLGGHNVYVRSVHTSAREHVLFRTVDVRLVNGRLEAKSMIAGVWFEVRSWHLRNGFGPSVSGFSRWPEQA